MGVHIGTMNGGMATGGPAGPLGQSRGVVLISQFNAARSRNLGMASQTQVGITRHQHFVIDGAMMVVAGGATFSQSLVFENKRSALVLMALTAGSVGLPDHFIVGQHDVLAVGAVTGVAGKALFLQWMVVLEIEKRLNLRMTLVAGCGIFAGVDDVLAPAAPGGHMETAGTVAGFAAKHFLTIRQGDLKFGMPGVFKVFYRFRMAQSTAFHTDVFCPRYSGRRLNLSTFHGGAGKQQQRHQSGEGKAKHLF